MHRRTTGSLSLAALLAATTCGCAAAVGGSVGRDRTTTTRPATTVRVPLLPYFRGLKTAALTIDGGSYTFLLDTGGGRTLITPTVAATLGCRPYGRDVGYRMNGEAVTFQNCERLDASIGAFTVRLAPVAVFDVAALLPAELPPLHGVLSLDAFREHLLTIDWANGALTVHS